MPTSSSCDSAALRSRRAHSAQNKADIALLRTLYAIVLDPSRKFGSMEEQIFLLAQAFQARGGVFLPLFSAPEHPGTIQMYQDRGLEVAFLDLNRFQASSLEQLVTL